jgi:hypothetical protein
MAFRKVGSNSGEMSASAAQTKGGRNEQSANPRSPGTTLDLSAAGNQDTLAAYESGPTVKAFIEPLAVGDLLPDMPLFLEPGAHILMPLEATYCAAFASVPLRWQKVL